MVWSTGSWWSAVGLGMILSISGMAYGQTHDRHGECQQSIIRSVEQFSVPDVTLINQDNRRIQFGQVLAESQPVLVEFFFTTCTTFCDIRAARLLSVQKALAKDGIEMGFFSITTDPEFDTPSRLRSYASRFRPVPKNWSLLTGKAQDIQQIERSFDARNPSADKMLHQPLTFIRPHPDSKWIRLEGMMSNDVLAEQVRRVVAESNSLMSRMSEPSVQQNSDGLSHMTRVQSKRLLMQ